MRIKYVLLLVIAISTGTLSFGQVTDTIPVARNETNVMPYNPAPLAPMPDYNKYRLPSLMAGAGIMTFFGDLGTYDCKITQVGKFNRGLAFGIEQRIGSALGISLNGVTGSLCEVDNRATRHMNFKSSIMQGNIGLNFHLDNGFIIHKTSRFSPYLSVGFGYMTFLAKGDLKDKDNKKYCYWPDGTIRDQNFDWENPQNGNVLVRDYSFETELDTLNLYTHNTLTIPVGGGINFKFSDKIEANISSIFFFTQTDAIDNLSYQKTNKFKFFNTHNDSYLFTNITLQYNFGGKSWNRLNNAPYKGINFRKLYKEDSDGDGVKDNKDKCPETPKGIKVDKNGCPIDSDKDGVPDYLDKAPMTPVGVNVDEDGVPLTPQMIEAKYIQDSLIMEGQLAQDREYTMSKSNVADSVIQQRTADYYKSIANLQSTNENPNNAINFNTSKTAVNTSNTSTSANTSGLVYRAQIASGADGNSKDYYRKNYNIREEIFVDPYQGTYKYSVGTFSTYADAKTYSSELKATLGISSFVVAFKDGVRLANAMQIPTQNVVQNQNTNQNQTTNMVSTNANNVVDTAKTVAVNNNTNTSNTNITNNTATNNSTNNVTTTANTAGTTYRAQIGSGADGNSTDYYAKKYNITDEIFVDQVQGTYKYTVGAFPTYAEAKTYTNELKAKSGLSSFVVKYQDGARAGSTPVQPQNQAQNQNTNQNQTTNVVSTNANNAVDTAKAVEVNVTNTNVTNNNATNNTTTTNVTNANTAGVTYRAQIGSGSDANSKEYYQKKLNLTDEIYVEDVQGTYKYTVGTFSTYNEAKAYVNQLKTKSGASSFVVKYKDGERVTGSTQVQPQNQNLNTNQIKEQNPTNNIENNNTTNAVDTVKVIVPNNIINNTNIIDTSNTKTNIPANTSSNVNNTGIVYRVQIGSLGNGDSKGYYQKTYNITDEIFVDSYQGTYKYSVGSFSTYADAKSYVNELKAKSNVTSFVIAIKDGVIIPVSEAKAITGK